MFEAVESFKRLFGKTMFVYESVFALFLNRANKIIGFAQLSSGAVSYSVMDIRMLCKYAIDLIADGVLLIHNHPSGNSNPSDNDIDSLKKAERALDVFGIRLINSLIITEKDIISIKDYGNK